MAFLLNGRFLPPYIVRASKELKVESEPESESQLEPASALDFSSPLDSELYLELYSEVEASSTASGPEDDVADGTEKEESEFEARELEKSCFAVGAAVLLELAFCVE